MTSTDGRSLHGTQTNESSITPFTILLYLASVTPKKYTNRSDTNFFVSFFCIVAIIRLMPNSVMTMPFF